MGQPHAAADFSVVPDAKEFVGRGHHVKIGRFFISEKGVRHPHVAQVFRADGQDFHAALALKRQPLVFPVLAEVNIHREILINRKKKQQPRRFIIISPQLKVQQLGQLVLVSILKHFLLMLSGQPCQWLPALV